MRLTFPRLQYRLIVGIKSKVPCKNHNIQLHNVVISKPIRKHSGVIQYDYSKAIHNSQFQSTGTVNKPSQALLVHIGQLEAKRMIMGETALSKIVEEALTQSQCARTIFTPRTAYGPFIPFLLSYLLPKYHGAGSNRSYHTCFAPINQ